MTTAGIEVEIDSMAELALSVFVYKDESSAAGVAPVQQLDLDLDAVILMACTTPRSSQERARAI